MELSEVIRAKNGCQKNKSAIQKIIFLNVVTQGQTIGLKDRILFFVSGAEPRQIPIRIQILFVWYNTKHSMTVTFLYDCPVQKLEK